MRNTVVVLTALLGCSVLPACGGAIAEEDEQIGTTSQSLTSVTSFGSNPGNLNMYTHVPAGLPAGRPLVVMLHGCNQSAALIDQISEWSVLASRYNFAVVYPEQKTSNNADSCFTWFSGTDITRNKGEVLSIKQMVDYMKTTYGVDGTRVYVSGLSAGGYMTTALMATYPDVFAAGAVSSGGPYKCATTVAATTSCMNGTTVKTPKQWGDLVRGAYSGYTGPYPKLVAFHGQADTRVYPQNMTEDMKQWTNVNGADQTVDFTESFRGATHNIYRTSAGRDVVETWSFPSMAHGLAVDPGSNVDQGGQVGTNAFDVNVYSSYYAGKSFGLF